MLCGCGTLLTTGCADAPGVKKAAVAGYGARIYFCEPTLVARETTAERVMEEQRAAGAHAVFVHPYDEAWVIAGQGTLGIELHQQVAQLEQRAACSHAAEASASAADPSPNAWQRRGTDEPQLDFVVAPVGGGGMMSGVSTAVTSLDKRIEVHGAEPAGE
jgi:threonine dehydratase